jgi:hypothetical protein
VFNRSIEEAHAAIEPLVAEKPDLAELLPVQLDQVLAFYRGHASLASHLQKTLTAVSDSIQHRQLLDCATMGSRAQLLSCKGKNAGTWLLAIPMCQSTMLPNAAYRSAFRLRLGLPPVDEMPVRCHCGFDLDSDPHHHLSCNREKATTVNHRHDLIVDAIFFWARRAGCVVLKEPEDLDDRDERRADLLITMTTKEILADVVVRHPCAPSLVSQAAQAPLAAALDAERYKAARYRETAENMGAVFSAFAVETYGAFGPQAAELV